MTPETASREISSREIVSREIVSREPSRKSDDPSWSRAQIDYWLAEAGPAIFTDRQWRVLSARASGHTFHRIAADETALMSEERRRRLNVRMMRQEFDDGMLRLTAFREREARMLLDAMQGPQRHDPGTPTLDELNRPVAVRARRLTADDLTLSLRLAGARLG